MYSMFIALHLVKTHSLVWHWQNPMDLSLSTRCLFHTCLFLAIDVLMDLENAISISLYLKNFRDFLVHVPFDQGLSVGHNEVDLFGMPTMDDGFATMSHMEPHVTTGA